MKKSELVFIPYPGIGHLLSTIEFAKLLLERDDRFSVTVLVMRPAIEHIANLASSLASNIRFIDLPLVDPPPFDLLFKSVEKYASVMVESHRDCVKDAIVNHVLPHTTQLVGLVLDMFCSSMIDVANELGVPSYIFFTGSEVFLHFMHFLPNRHDRLEREFQKLDKESIIPGYINPVPTNSLPSFAFNKEGGYISMVNHGRRLKETKGILVNSFRELQVHSPGTSLSAIDSDSPPVYTVGPLINQKHFPPNEAQDDEIMNWLDDQPQSSVVLLCFGSWGVFDAPQLKEIALGLEQSGYRFLWSMRLIPNEERDENEVLPEGFQERTQDKGIICGWVPQVKILAHKAIGGFVSHCGWNSILESLWYGEPIITWPLYAEQQINAFMMVKELGLAVELRLDYRSGSDVIVVQADEIARALKSVMGEDNEVRKRVKEMSAKSREAAVVGGSSYASVSQLIESILGC